MSYELLKVTDHVDKWNVEKLRHVENGIVTNETNIEKLFIDLQEYALKNEIPNVEDFTTYAEVQSLINEMLIPENVLNMIALSQNEILEICK